MMAKEALYIPEDDLLTVIEIIREGMRVVKAPLHVAGYLTEWCNDEEAYIRA
jgi:hypothetical protein